MAIQISKSPQTRSEPTSRSEPIKTTEPIKVQQKAEEVGQEKESLISQQVRQPAESSNQKSIQDTVAELNLASQKFARNLEFSVDDSSGKTIITVKDRETEKVVRQIPSDEVLAIAERVESIRGDGGKNSGLLINTEV